MPHSRVRCAESLLALASEAGLGHDPSPLVEHGCLAIVRGMALDNYRQSLLAHIMMDLVGLLDAPETKAANPFAVPKDDGDRCGVL